EGLGGDGGLWGLTFAGRHRRARSNEQRPPTRQHDREGRALIRLARHIDRPSKGVEYPADDPETEAEALGVVGSSGPRCLLEDSLAILSLDPDSMIPDDDHAMIDIPPNRHPHRFPSSLLHPLLP